MFDFLPPGWAPVLVPNPVTAELLAAIMPRPLTAQELALPEWLRPVPLFNFSVVPVHQGLAAFVEGMIENYEVKRERFFLQRQEQQLPSGFSTLLDGSQSFNNSGQTLSSSAAAQGPTLCRATEDNPDGSLPSSASTQTPAINRPRSFNGSAVHNDSISRKRVKDSTIDGSSDAKSVKRARDPTAFEDDDSAPSNAKSVKRARKNTVATTPYPPSKPNTSHQSSSRDSRTSVWDRRWNRDTLDAIGVSLLQPTGQQSKASKNMSAVAAQPSHARSSSVQASSIYDRDHAVDGSNKDEPDFQSDFSSGSGSEELLTPKTSRQPKRPRYTYDEEDGYADAAPVRKKSQTNAPEAPKQNQPKKQSRSEQNSQGKRPRRKKRDSWSEEEHTALEQVLRAIREGEKSDGVAGLRDVQLWSEASRILQSQYSIDRTYTACKNYWSRIGRQRSGFDERANPDPKNLSTSLQKTKST